MKMRDIRAPRAPRTVLIGVATAVLALVGSACKDLLDVKNPNRIVEDDLSNPASADAQANGLGHSVTRALTAILAPYSDATDEVQYVGSRDSYDQLDKGFIGLVSNEFTGASWPYMTEARFMADATIKRLADFQAAGKLANPITLARALVYGAVIYSAIPDLFDDFVISTTDAAGRKMANPSIGNAALPILYDSAIAMTTRALAIADINLAANANLKAQALGIRARAKYAKGLYTKVPANSAWPAGPTTAALVTDAQGGGYLADVTAALAAGSGDWKLTLTPQATTVGFPIIGNDLNNRLELRAGDAYIIPSTGNPKRVGSIRLNDLINNTTPDPALTRAINSCCVQAVSDYVPITVISAREMRLLAAEAALAAGDNATFATNINAVRAFETGLTPWNSAAPQVPALDLLIHERRVNLYLQGRRLRDMYRFGIKDPQWLATSTAFLKAGCMLVVPQEERDPNPGVKPPSCQ